MTKNEFETGTNVVYPAHGVGKVTGVETQTISNMEFTAYVVSFERDKMTLRIPINRAKDAGLRSLCTQRDLDRVRRTLKGRAKTSRGMWSRRAKEYESKINSGNIVSLAEVVRDLHKNVDDPDRSYSERVIYENALDRLAGEVSAIESIDITNAVELLVKTINDNRPKEEDEEATAQSARVVALNELDDFDDTDEFSDIEENAA